MTGIAAAKSSVEGSNDGQTWLPYAVPNGKPGDVNRRPGLVAPFQPVRALPQAGRCGFAAFGGLPAESNGSLMFLISACWKARPDVLAPLMATNPFPAVRRRAISAPVFTITNSPASEITRGHGGKENTWGALLPGAYSLHGTTAELSGAALLPMPTRALASIAPPRCGHARCRSVDPCRAWRAAAWLTSDDPALDKRPAVGDAHHDAAAGIRK